jgi:alkylhydroperoxidase family enzyme
MAVNPGLFEPWGELISYLARDATVPARERELVMLRVGWRTQAVYEFGHHTQNARRIGMTDAEIGALTGDVEDGPWTTDEKTLLRMVDELMDDDCVTSATWDRLSSRWSPPELVELVALAGFYRMLSACLNTFGVEPEDGLPGWPGEV